MKIVAAPVELASAIPRPSRHAFVWPRYNVAITGLGLAPVVLSMRSTCTWLGQMRRYLSRSLFTFICGISHGPRFGACRQPTASIVVSRREP